MTEHGIFSLDLEDEVGGSRGVPAIAVTHRDSEDDYVTTFRMTSCSYFPRVRTVKMFAHQDGEMRLKGNKAFREVSQVFRDDVPLAMSVVDALAEHHSSTDGTCAPAPKVGPSSFELLRVIGKGGYGKVWLYCFNCCNNKGLSSSQEGRRRHWQYLRHESFEEGVLALRFSYFVGDCIALPHDLRKFRRSLCVPRKTSRIPSPSAIFSRKSR